MSLLSNLAAECLCVAAPWGKRGWKTFSGVLKGMVLYLQKVRDLMLSLKHCSSVFTAYNSSVTSHLCVSG